MSEVCLARIVKKEPEPHLCELCNRYLAFKISAGPVAYMCSSCEKIVAEWERRKKAQHKLFLALRRREKK